MPDVHPLNFAQVSAAAQLIANRWTGKGVDSVMPVMRGGLYPATVVASSLGVPLVEHTPTPLTLVVDDLVDSGRTAKRFDGIGLGFDACYRKPHSPVFLAPEAIEVDAWLTFPWEVDANGDDTSAEDGVVRLLEHIGEDPNREGLLDTPKRVAKAMREMTVGYDDDPAVILGTTFDVSCDEMIVLDGIEFVSLCEHHLLPFTGTATVGYVPGESQRVVGLSKLARLVECYARRLQVQERMTSQIVEAIEQHLSPLGAGVVVRAHHHCMGCRGVRKQSAVMVTSALVGNMRNDPTMRAEFLSLTR